MAGNSVSANSAKHEEAVAEVVKGFEAMKRSAEGATSLGAAQKTMFWGHEVGPRALQDSSSELFNAVAEALKNEAALISTFEAEINAVMASFTGTEYENKAQMEQINQALDRVAKSDAAVALKASLNKVAKAAGWAPETSTAAGSLMGALAGTMLMNGGVPHASSAGSTSGSTSAPIASSGPRSY
ncbi:MAG: hypothetical protein E7C13_05195 [Actinomyces sp.]|jgi:hypothetical protein|nr:hypothetical protein [Actinomyces sp.]